MRYFVELPLFLTLGFAVALYFALDNLNVWPPLAFVGATVGFVVSSLYLKRVINHFRR